MGGLFFLGVKKSSIKKLPLVKHLFDLRDKQNYRRIYAALASRYAITEVSAAEAMLQYPLNGKEVKLLFRKFPCSDLSVLQQVFEHERYGPVIKKMKEHFSAADPVTIIDAGANVGYAALYFKAFFPAAQIVAIEPEQKNKAQLQKNLAVNGLSINEVIGGALWHQDSFLEVVRDFRNNREASFTVRETPDHTGIKGHSFADVLAGQGWPGADLVKIDIEGGERFLFDTNEKADAILKKTKFLAIEIHDEFEIRPAIYAHLKRNNFSWFEYDDLTFAVDIQKLTR